MHGTAACVTVNVWPAAVIVALREPPVFAVALYDTDPLPRPNPMDVTLSQPAELLAVQTHSRPVETLQLPLPPLADTEALLGLIE